MTDVTVLNLVWGWVTDVFWILYDLTRNIFAIFRKNLCDLTRNIFMVWREISVWFDEKDLCDLTRRNLCDLTKKNRNKVFIQFRCRYVDDDSIQPRLRPVHWRFLDQDSPAKYGSSIFLSSAMLRNINSNPMPRYKNASEKSHQLNMHDEFRLLKVKRLSVTLSFIPKSIFDCDGCSHGHRNCFSK